MIFSKDEDATGGWLKDTIVILNIKFKSDFQSRQHFTENTY